MSHASSSQKVLRSLCIYTFAAQMVKALNSNEQIFAVSYTKHVLIKKFIFVLICSTPDMSRMHGDNTGDLRVVARVLKDVIGVCNLTHIKLGCTMLIIV